MNYTRKARAFVVSMYYYKNSFVYNKLGEIQTHMTQTHVVDVNENSSTCYKINNPHPPKNELLVSYNFVY